MRIIWNRENYFQAEITVHTEHWKSDVDLLKIAGFKTDGPPNWIWKTERIAPLDYLKKHKPESGLFITELALEKYTFLKEQNEKKKVLKKELEKLKREVQAHSAPKWEEYSDEETGITCFVVKPSETKFKLDYVAPKPSDVLCFICGSPLYLFDLPDICLWCDKQQQEKA